MALRLAIAGATGVVGSELIEIINREQPQLGSIGLYASRASAGSEIEMLEQHRTVADVASCDFAAYDAVFFCVGDELSAKYVPLARAARCGVVDKSNTYRLAPGVPLVVAGVNEDQIHSGSKLVANPNCTTIVLAHALGALQRSFGLHSVFAASYQSVSGAGRSGATRLLDELEDHRADAYQLRPASPSAEAIAFNVLPQIGPLDSEGRAGEEVKLIEETRKILALPNLPIVAHAVRVPVLVGHALAVTVELESAASSQDLEAAWQDTMACRFLKNGMPTPLGSSRHDRVEIGRLRAEPQLQHGWSFFVCGDNLRIGAALNGWSILKAMARAGAVPEFSATGEAI